MEVGPRNFTSSYNVFNFYLPNIILNLAWTYAGGLSPYRIPLTHHYTTESKQQSKQWTEAGCSAPKKTRLVPSTGKVMVSVFWNAEGILYINYLEKGKK
jgi:hypothetical protein